MNIQEAAQQLAYALSSTHEFEQLKNARQIIANNRQLSSLITAFEQKKNQVYGNLSEEQSRQLMAELSTDYENLNAIPEIKKYFSTEENMNQLIESAIDAVATRIKDLLQK